MSNAERYTKSDYTIMVIGGLLMTGLLLAIVLMKSQNYYGEELDITINHNEQ